MAICSETRTHTSILPFGARRASRKLTLLVVQGLLAAILFFPLLASAAGERTVTLSDQLPFVGDVKEVYLVVTSRGRILHSALASWVESTVGDSITCIGRVPVGQEDSELEVLFVATGVTGNVRSSFRTVNLAETPPTAFLSSVELRDRLIERRGVLRQLQSEVRTQDERLQGLQEDADVIANVSRIVTAEDELAEIKRRIAQVDEAY